MLRLRNPEFSFTVPKLAEVKWMIKQENAKNLIVSLTKFPFKKIFTDIEVPELSEAL
jgi:hypothetical protein